MTSREEQLSLQERQQRLREGHYTKQVAAKEAQRAISRQQAEQAAQRSYGIPSTTGLLAYPILGWLAYSTLAHKANLEHQGQMSPQGNKSNEPSPEKQERRRLLVFASRNQSLSPEQLQQAKVRQLAAQRGQEIAGLGFQQMGDGIISSCPSDLELRMGLEADVPDFINFRSACREGDLSTTQSILSSQSRSRLYLHKGLDDAIKNGKVDVARFLLQSGAPMTREAPAAVLKAPADKQVALFQMLIEHGWTVNTPASLLPEIFRSNNEPLFDWFLEQGADPDVAGPQHD
ncbi:ankyrin repeat domain-containing protein [Fusarium heterosporum]|uniref:Ankyrin repeat domain-containing protein n=1 Tax=Fusarium heterosporum TaxID=42747 RepID=A0A8H5SU18_FUSHE|nr:ankyrin repeat domain-containing protein [Fusarium heterosporum]